MVDEFDKFIADIKAVIISSVVMFFLSLGSIGVIVTTFSEFKGNMIWSRFGIVTLLFSVGASLLWGFRRKIPTIIAGLLIFLIPFVLTLYGTNFDTGLSFVTNVLKVRSLVFLHLPGRISTVGSEQVTSIFLIYSAAAIFIGALTFLKRCPAILTMILFIIPPLLAAQINDLFPQPTYCVLFAFGILFLIFADQIRKCDQIKAQDRLIKLSLIAFLMAFIPAFLYPMDGYKKFEIANRHYEYFEKELSGKFEELLPSFKKQWHYKGAAILEDGILKNFDTGHEYLNTVGYFDPKPIPVFEVTRYRNLDYEGVLSSSSVEYIKLGTLDIYENNMWTRDPQASNYSGTTSMIIGSGAAFEPGQFISKIEQHALFKSDLDVTYSELYEGHSEPDEYSNNVFPVPKMDDDIYWEPDYLRDVVQDSDLYVPEGSKKAILETGVLPSWYLDVYYGRTTMSDIEKVQKVTEYVSGLHVYRRDTPYQPEDQDFVAYFLKEAKSGFCVHYNTTAAVLLRMIGVPTRYVTGYMASGIKYEQENTVTLENAHAWFEFFDSDFGWVLGDATPGNKLSARDYDINGILEQYNLSEYKTEPTPKPVDHNAYQPTMKPFSASHAGDQEEEMVGEYSEEGIVRLWKLTPVKVIAIVIGSIVALWLIYATWTFISLNFGKPDRRARAYYRYYKRVFFFLGTPVPKIAVHTGEKAAFSKDGITLEELNESVRTTNEFIKQCTSSRPRPIRIIVHLLLA